MSVLDGCWHLLNFFAPAFGTGIIAAFLAKLLWWRDLRNSSFQRLAGAAIAAACLALLAGLLWTGRDGKMLTYAAMVCSCALALWWCGWGAGRR